MERAKKIEPKQNGEGSVARKEMLLWNDVWSKVDMDGEENVRTTRSDAILSETEGKIVLDVGCGDLYYSNISDYAKHLVGVDVSETALRKAIKSVNTDLIVASGDFLPFRNGVFDLVMSVETITTQGSESRYVRFLSEMTRVSSSEVAFEVRHLDMPLLYLKTAKSEVKYGRTFDWKGIEIVCFTEKGIRELLSDVGLEAEVIHVETKNEVENFGVPIFQQRAVPDGEINSSINVKAVKKRA